MKKIYILDDERPVLEPLAMWFERRHFMVKTFQRSFDFLTAMMNEKPSVIIMDINLIEDDGRTLCRLVKAKYRDRVPVILISASPSLGDGYEEYEADAFIEKPFSFSAIQKVVNQYIPDTKES